MALLSSDNDISGLDADKEKVKRGEQLSDCDILDDSVDEEEDWGDCSPVRVLSGGIVQLGLANKSCLADGFPTPRGRDQGFPRRLNTEPAYPPSVASRRVLFGYFGSDTLADRRPPDRTHKVTQRPPDRSSHGRPLAADKAAEPLEHGQQSQLRPLEIKSAEKPVARKTRSRRSCDVTTMCEEYEEDPEVEEDFPGRGKTQEGVEALYRHAHGNSGDQDELDEEHDGEANDGSFQLQTCFKRDKMSQRAQHFI